MQRRFVAVLAACVVASGIHAQVIVASEQGLEGFVSVERLPLPEDPFLQAGRQVWGDNCSNCHGGNKATGAPKVTSTRAWDPRIAQGMETLIDHALNGFVGPKYTQMPARGANPDLTDEEVASAVAFMVWTSGGAATVQDYLNNKQGTDK